MKSAFTILLCLVAYSLLAEPYIVKSDTKVWAANDMHAKVLGSIKMNSTVEVQEEDKGWYKITYNGGDGYVPEKYLKETISQPEEDSGESNTIYIFGGCALALIVIVAGAWYRYAPKKKGKKRNLVITPQLIAHWYQCRHCSVYIQKTSEASITGCEKAHAHHWIKLGEVGEHKYICKKCSTIINVVSEPVIDGCKDGGQHHWKKV
jgi:hypothetical protein